MTYRELHPRWCSVDAIQTQVATARNVSPTPRFEACAVVTMFGLLLRAPRVIRLELSHGQVQAAVDAMMCHWHVANAKTILASYTTNHVLNAAVKPGHDVKRQNAADHQPEAEQHHSAV